MNYSKQVVCTTVRNKVICTLPNLRRMSDTIEEFESKLLAINQQKDKIECSFNANCVENSIKSQLAGKGLCNIDIEVSSPVMKISCCENFTSNLLPTKKDKKIAEQFILEYNEKIETLECLKKHFVNKVMKNSCDFKHKPHILNTQQFIDLVTRGKPDGKRNIQSLLTYSSKYIDSSQVQDEIINIYKSCVNNTQYITKDCLINNKLLPACYCICIVYELIRLQITEIKELINILKKYPQVIQYKKSFIPNKIEPVIVYENNKFIVNLFGSFDTFSLTKNGVTSKLQYLILWFNENKRMCMKFK